MKTILKASVLVLAVVAILGGLTLWLYFPRSSKPSQERVSRSPEHVARGRYLVEHVAFCLDCHSERNWDFYGGPTRKATKGGGGPVEILGDIGRKSSAANITSFGIGDWSDGEIRRAITEGVRADGSPVNPLMPFDAYRHLSRRDADAIVAYLRVLPAIDNVPAASELPLPLRIVARLLPSPWEAPDPIDPSDRVAYGRYLVQIAECDFCHGGDMSGGVEFDLPSGGVVRSSNLTPEPETGLGGRDRDNFIGIFEAFADPESRLISVPPGEANTVMPWLRYAGMSEDDLGAIWAYLQTLEPVTKSVHTWP